jgi:hypothetical protein
MNWQYISNTLPIVKEGSRIRWIVWISPLISSVGVREGGGGGCECSPWDVQIIKGQAIKSNRRNNRNWTLHEYDIILPGPWKWSMPKKLLALE